MTDLAPFPAFVSKQLEELRLRLLTEFERLHGSASTIDVELHELDKEEEGLPRTPRVHDTKKHGRGVVEAHSARGHGGKIAEVTNTHKEKEEMLDDDQYEEALDDQYEEALDDQDDAQEDEDVPVEQELQPMMDVRTMDVHTDSLHKLNTSTKQDGRLVDGRDEAAILHQARQPHRVFATENTEQTLDQLLMSRELGSRGVGSHLGSRENSITSDRASVDPIAADIDKRVRRFSNASLSVAEATMKKDTFAGNGVINPMSSVYSNWSNFISVLVIFSCFLTPFRYGFLPTFGPVDYVDSALDTTSGLPLLLQLLDVVFALDIVLTFNVAVVTKEGLEFTRKKIFFAYIGSTRFLIDVVATIPFDYIITSISENTRFNQDVAHAMGLLRLLRVNRLLLLFRKLQKNTYFNLVGVVVAKFVVFILLCTHTSGCIFYKLAQYEGFDDTTWVYQVDPDLPHRNLLTRYIHALFWAVGCFKAGPTSGALGPSSNSEMILACLTMMVNICLGTYLVSNMAALLTTTDVKIYNMRNQLMQVRDFGWRHKLPPELQFQLMAFIRFKFSTHDEVDQSLLSGLPDMYRQRINFFLFEDIVRGVALFQNCASVFLRQLHGNFKAALYMPDQQLATIDGPCTTLQLLAEGEVEFLSRNGGVIDIRGEGECFTAVSFLCKVGQPYSVRTRMVCRVLSIGYPNWEAACTSFPGNLLQVRHNLLTLCKDKAAEFMPATLGFTVYNDVLQTVQQHLVQQEELNIALLCSSAARGDIGDIKRRLVAQSPNCSNYDRRTPLHLAAAHGQPEACRLLLDAEADVDPIDNFGRTPLFEACRARQDVVTHLLHARGARLGRSRVDHDSSSERANETEQTTAAGELCQAASDVEQLWYLRALLRYNADPNTGDYDARTALHVANASGNKAAVQLLLSHAGIDFNCRDNFGRTPLMEAVRHGHEECARVMQKAGAFHGFIIDLKENTDPNAVGAGQELCQAAFSNQVSYLYNLINYCGIHVDAADYDLRTALMLASAEGNMPVAVSLVRNKADVHRTDRWGHTAITEAEEHGHDELARVLRLMDEKGG